MKRKMFQKLMAASLTAAMAIGMAGCGGKDTPSGSGSSAGADNTGAAGGESSTPSEEVSKYPILKDADGNVYDLGGMEVVIYSWFDETVPDDAFGEAQTEWREWAQETYNFKISNQAIGDWGSNPDKLVEYVTTGGDDNNYIYVLHNGTPQMISAMEGGLLYDVGKIAAKYDWLDFSEKKFQDNGQCNYFSKGDSVYAFRTGIPEPRDGVYFNTRLLEQTTGLKAEDLYKLQADNKWTWAEFEKICDTIKAKGDVDNDGVQDIYSWDGNRGDFVKMAVYSNGGSFFGRKDGKFTYNVEDAKSMEGINWAAKMMNDYEYPDPTGGAQWDYYKAAFSAEGKYVFYPAQAWEMTGTNNVALLEDNWGFVTFPYGPGATTNVNVSGDNVYVLPGCYDDEKAWKIMFAYDLYTDDIPGFEDYNAGKGQYYANAKDTQTVDETIVRMMEPENTIFPYSELIPNLDMGAPFLHKFWPGCDVAANVEAISTAWKTLVDEANAK